MYKLTFKNTLIWNLENIQQFKIGNHTNDMESALVKQIASNSTKNKLKRYVKLEILFTYLPLVDKSRLLGHFYGLFKSYVDRKGYIGGQSVKCISGAALLGGQGGHLPTQFFRDQRQKIPQNCKIGATCMHLLQMLSKFEVCPPSFYKIALPL